MSAKLSTSASRPFLLPLIPMRDLRILSSTSPHPESIRIKIHNVDRELSQPGLFPGMLAFNTLNTNIIALLRHEVRSYQTLLAGERSAVVFEAIEHYYRRSLLN